MAETGIVDRFFTRIKAKEITKIGSFRSKDRESAGPFLQEPWLSAYIEGNVLIPQRHYAINPLVLESVLANPPVNWDEFAKCVLSEEQLSRLGKIMTNAHRSKDISRAATGLAVTGEGKVSNGRLQELWKGPRDTAYQALLAYSKLAPGEVFGGADGFAQLKVIVGNMTQRLKAEDVRRHMEQYRAILVQRKKVTYPSANIEYEEAYKPLMDNLRAINAGLRDAIESSEVDDGVKKIATRIIADSSI